MLNRPEYQEYLRLANCEAQLNHGLYCLLPAFYTNDSSGQYRGALTTYKANISTVQYKDSYNIPTIDTQISALKGLFASSCQ